MTLFDSISNIQYAPPFLLPGGHVQTIFPAVARHVHGVLYCRERIHTDDDDFLDLDWSSAASPSRRLTILCHGLEGHSKRAYILGMVRALNDAHWDALAWNYRSCSGEPNRQLRFYHNGATDDLQRVVQHAVETDRYDQIALVGFSLGGNMVLNYLAWHKALMPAQIFRAVVFSVPLHIASSAAALARPANRIYMKRFLMELKKKILAKEKRFPEAVSSDGYSSIKDFRGFDDRYTAPIHGFADAGDYWHKCSGVFAIPHISLPTLIVNAQNDPFLTPECFPIEAAVQNNNVLLLMPKGGGHCGFPAFNRNGRYWSEEITCRFFNDPE
ncbi:MAG: alpha/beta fold hydrolase [Deltaproteobacteria bacterium]|nr:alpha/beta fold hydrolase [Deltaproteobacteria bacterium]